MQQLRTRNDAGEAPRGAGERYCQKLAHYPERNTESVFVRLLKAALRALRLKRRLGRAAG